MVLTASKSKDVSSTLSAKKSPKKLTLLDLIDIDQLVNEHAEIVNITSEIEDLPEGKKHIAESIAYVEEKDKEDAQQDIDIDEKHSKNKVNRKCSYCRKGFMVQSKLKEHVKNCYMKKHPCKECDLKFATESKLERHVNECHLQIKEFQCNDCEKSFARKDKLADHVEAVHQKKQKYLCSKCGKGFYHKFNMTRHVITCKRRGKKKEPRECPECDKEFKFKSELKRHIEVVHLKVKRHKCEHCAKGFSQKCMLEDHVNAVHLKKREHQCQDCGNSFARLSQLNRHVSAVHMLEKQHECPECDKCFARKDRLKSHVMSVHVKEFIKGGDGELSPKDHVIETLEHTPEKVPETINANFPMQPYEPQSIVGVVDQLNNFNVVTTQPSLETTTVLLSDGEYVHGINIAENEYEVVVNVPADLQISNNPFKTNNMLTTRIPSQEDTIVQSQASNLVIVDENEIKKQRESKERFVQGGSKPIKYDSMNCATVQTKILLEVCPECDEGFSRKDRLKTHLIDNHLTISPNDSVSDDGDKTLTPKKSIQENSMCIIDHQAFASHEGRKITNSLFNSGLTEEERKMKMKRELAFDAEKNKYECPECSKFFSRTDKLDDHISTVHFMERRYQCTSCGKSFAYKHGLERHVSTFHLNEAKYKCRLCDDRFDQKEQLESHIVEIHSNQNKIKCNQCDKWFARKRSLEEHVSVVHLKVKKYKCPKCNKSFSTKGVRKSHLAVHSKDKPYKCKECGKGFNYKHILARHLLTTHPTEKTEKQSFKCADCDKSFISQEKLLKHVKAVHSKAKNIPCADCELTFTTETAKEKHISLEHLKENKISDNKNSEK